MVDLSGGEELGAVIKIVVVLGVVVEIEPVLSAVVEIRVETRNRRCLG